jgi:Dyp-type peroxidase family
MSYDPSDAQGNIVRGYRHLHYAGYLFCEISDPVTARGLLAELAASEVTTDETWREKTEIHSTLNVAFTYPGLMKLQWAPPFALDRFRDFREGMYVRAVKQLGDPGATYPDSWEPRLSLGADVLFVIYGDERKARDQRMDDIRRRAGQSGLSELYSQDAEAPANSEEHVVEREHFGFADGFSQPAIDLSAHAAERGECSPRGEGAIAVRGPLNWRPQWRPVRLGELLLGFEDEDGVTAGGADPYDVLSHGTFMVWRKIEQHKDRLERFLEHAEQRPGERERLAAKIVGRWKDGTSLVVAPYQDPPPDSTQPPAMPKNEFDYSTDEHGLACPLGAHVRRANPRVGLKYGTERTKRHRIIRRGMPYEDGAEQGLIFVCFNACITRQFELIQGRWLMDGDAFGLGGDQDFLLGQASDGKMTIPGEHGRPARFLRRPEQPFVSVHGGYYLFLPGMSALLRIAAGPPGGSLRSRLGRWARVKLRALRSRLP